MKDVVFFLQKEIWGYLKQKTNSRYRAYVCDAMAASKLVHTDFTQDDVDKDDELFQVYKDSGGSRFVFGLSSKNEYINSTLTAALCSTYLLKEDTGFCEKMQLRQGRAFLNEDLLDKNPSFFEDKDCYISKDLKYEKGWENSELCSVIGNHTCNALILIDPYICTVGNACGMNDNLKSLLNVLLPCSLNIPFHLSIFTKLTDQTKGKEVYQQISEVFKTIRPLLDVKFTLYSTHDIHDRMVLTNNYMIKVGAGFDLFKNGKAVNETTVDYSPKKSDIYYRWLKHVTKISRKSEANENYANHWGSKENRLFDLVETEHTKAKEDMASTKVERPLINTSDVPKVDGVKIVGKIDLPADSQRRIR